MKCKCSRLFFKTFNYFEKIWLNQIELNFVKAETKFIFQIVKLTMWWCLPHYLPKMDHTTDPNIIFIWIINSLTRLKGFLIHLTTIGHMNIFLSILHHWIIYTNLHSKQIFNSKNTWWILISPTVFELKKF